MQRTLRVLAALAVLVFPAAPASAQPDPTVRVARATTVRDSPRGDSVPIGKVGEGQVLTVLSRRENWFLVAAPDTPGITWQRGWIHVSFLEGGSIPAPAAEGRPARPRPPGSLRVRGFGQTGGMIFTARDSFETITDKTFGLFHGGGAQVVLPNGAFFQVSTERYRKTGSRALVSGSQLFLLDIPAEITVTPIFVTAGYRAPEGRYVPYLGGGVGWHALREDAPTLAGASTSQDKIGYHLLGGVELPVTRWFGLAGEVQWTAVPKALGETGVSALFDEDDLGGTSFRLKILVGF